MKKMEYKTFAMKVDGAAQADDVGNIEGYASTFGNEDLGGDIVDKGAFKRSIRARKGHFPILLDHHPYKQIGWNLEADEDDTGLNVKGEIQLVMEEAKNRFRLAKRAMDLKTQMGLSIGYWPVKIAFEDIKDAERPRRIRHLKEVNLVEYSLVTFPMNEQAGITGAKDFFSLFDKLRNGGYTIEQIQKALDHLDDSGGQPATPSNDPSLRHSFDQFEGFFKR